MPNGQDPDEEHGYEPDPEEAEDILNMEFAKDGEEETVEARDGRGALAADHDLLLINRMTPATDASEVVLFDVRTEAVVDEVTLPHKTGDVLTRDGRHMVYATTNEVVIYDRVRREVHAAFPIPERAGNFHASLLRAPSA